MIKILLSNLTKFISAELTSIQPQKNLMNWHIAHSSYITDDALHHVHWLWPTKTPESRVGWNVCLASITSSRDIGNVVRIVTMHDRSFQYLTKINITGCEQAVYPQEVKDRLNFQH